MAINRDPILKRCRALGISPAVLGYDKESHRNPKGDVRKKLSKYGVQLKEKQKLKFIYGVMEKQFYNYYEMAAKKAGMTGENLLVILESRLDNIVWRMGMASTRREARQLVTHGHFTLNGNKVDIPSLLVKTGDVVAVKEASRSSAKFKALAEALDTKSAPKWLDLDKTNLSVKVVNAPARDDIDYEVDEQQIVEFYSK
ncbi:MAG: 30S ribosomal protein S4 [Clostridia bacterium]|nr:30S ribosomal protein S4 [Clostridia bacterium]